MARFQVTTRLDIARAGGPVQAWIPLPSLREPNWIVPGGDDWTSNATTAEVWIDPKYGARMLHATFAEGVAAPTVEVVSRFTSRDRAADLAAPGAPVAARRAGARALSRGDRARCRPTASSRRRPG